MSAESNITTANQTNEIRSYGVANQTGNQTNPLTKLADGTR
jgi:hypothetical protein